MTLNGRATINAALRCNGWGNSIKVGLFTNKASILCHCGQFEYIKHHSFKYGNLRLSDMFHNISWCSVPIEFSVNKITGLSILVSHITSDDTPFSLCNLHINSVRFLTPHEKPKQKEEKRRGRRGQFPISLFPWISGSLS